MDELCKKIAAEKDPEKHKKLVLELSNLVEPTLASIQPKPTRN